MLVSLSPCPLLPRCMHSIFPCSATLNDLINGTHAKLNVPNAFNTRELYKLTDFNDMCAQSRDRYMYMKECWCRGAPGEELRTPELDNLQSNTISTWSTPHHLSI